MAAVEELFPERFRELEQIGRSFADLAPEDEESDELREHIHEWAEENHIACDSVERVAALIAAGVPGPDRPSNWVEDENGNVLEPSPISAQPQLGETRDEFLARAKMHYERAVELYQKHHILPAPIRRKDDTFRWVAKRFVGQKPWSQIAEEEQRLGMSAKSIESVARDAALVIGLPFPRIRGRRKGTSNVPRERRRSDLHPRRSR
jgi:hypothetical protein